MVDRTYCRICEAACGLVVDRDAHGEVTGLRPDKEHPTSRGFVCAKGTRFLEVARHPSRLRAPMERGPGGLRPVSWQDATAAVGAKLREIRERYGEDAVGVYFGNPLAFNALGSAALLAFLKGLKSRNIFSAGSQDCSNKFAAASLLHGSPVIHPIPDFERCELAVLFGTNPAVSQSSFVHLEGGSLVFSRILARGGRVVWVDPRRSESAARWGEHVAIRPGADVWLLLALLHELRDRARPDDRVEGLDRLLALAARYPAPRAAALTGIEAEQIVSLGARLRASRATALHMSVGVNQGAFGTLAYVALQALSYLCGSLDADGGSLFHPLSLGLAALFHRLDVGEGRTRSRVGHFPSVLDAMPGGILADEILTPGPGQIRALVVIAGDPLRSVPGGERLEKALGSLDLLVSIDLFENSTGKLARWLLPATSWLERWDFATTTVTFQKSPLVQVSGPVLPPQGQSRDEARILLDLLAAITGRRALSGLGAAASLARWLPTPRHGVPAPRPKAGAYLGRGPRTPGRRVRFWSDALDGEASRLAGAAQATADEGVFSLLCRRRRLGHNSWLHDALRDGDAEEEAWISESDAASMGLSSGGKLRIESEAGSLLIAARAREGVAPGTVVVPHGLPGVNVNAIVPSGPGAVEPLSGQLRMTGVPVRVSVVP